MSFKPKININLDPSSKGNSVKNLSIDYKHIDDQSVDKNLSMRQLPESAKKKMARVG